MDMDMVVQDGQQDHHKRLRSHQVTFEPAHSAYAATHTYAYNSTQYQSYLPDPTELGSPSDLTNWLADTGATDNMTPCLTGLTRVENGPDESI
jgi:hypothetical protein